MWFTARGHGYGVPKDGFGYEGFRPTLRPGGTFRLQVVLFEGTYTAEFSDHSPPTPRHHYNQILYRLDFADILPGG